MVLRNNEQRQGTINSIENADATPPHLGVILRLVSSDGMQGSLQVFAFGLFS